MHINNAQMRNGAASDHSVVCTDGHTDVPLLYKQYIPPTGDKALLKAVVMLSNEVGRLDGNWPMILTIYMNSNNT